MELSEAEALKVAWKYMAPGSKHIKTVEHGDLFIFQINGPDPLEGDLDPFFAVNKKTGEFRDYSIVEDQEVFKQFV